MYFQYVKMIRIFPKYTWQTRPWGNISPMNKINHPIEFDGKIRSCGLIVLFHVHAMRWESVMTSQIICYISASSSHTWWIPPSNTGSFLQQHKITCLSNERCKEMTSQNICTAGGVQWRILDFLGGVPTTQVGVRTYFFGRKLHAWKRKNFGPQGGAHPWRPPYIRHWSCVVWIVLYIV